jgi:pSer/pThr/pTyr-binding forkhead associated (FHA) protein
MDAILKILSGPRSGETIPVPRGKLLVGREVDCQLRSDSASVSRHHSVLLLDEYTLRIRDLGSKNGTYVNGRRLGAGQTALLHGDIISIASIVELTFEIQLVLAPIGAEPGGLEAVPSDRPSALEGTVLLDGDTASSKSAAGGPTPSPEPFRTFPTPVIPGALPLPQRDAARGP